MNKISLVLFLCTQLIFSQNDTVNITEGTFKVSARKSKEFIFGFAKGDQIVFDFKEKRGKSVRKVEIFEYPSQLKYSEFKIATVEKKTIAVPKTGIYVFKITNTSFGKRICTISINRIPLDESTKNFNTKVSKRKVTDTIFSTQIQKEFVKDAFVTKSILDNETFYINSGSNALFKNGKSRIIIPINLPKNSVEWYYKFSSSRNETDVNNISKNVKLSEEITDLIDKTGVLDIGINQLTIPPGENYCDIYLIDRKNHQLFLNKKPFVYDPLYSRENIISGVVKVDKVDFRNLFLGVKNPNAMHGIHVSVEIVAVVKEDTYKETIIKTPHISMREELYIED